MKNIKKITALSIIGLLSFVGSVYSTHASDSIDWDDIEVISSYDYINQELDLEFSIEESSGPSDEYTLEFELDGEEQSGELLYSYSDDELYLHVSVDINEEDLEDEYNIEFEITNDDEDDDAEYDDTEYEDDLDVDVSNYIDWSDLEITNEYNNSSEYIKIELSLEDKDDTIVPAHYSYLEINSKTYSSLFRYSSSEDKYYAIHYVYIDREDLEDEYDYELIIKNKSYEEIYELDDEIDIEITEDDFSWSGLDIEGTYDEDDEELTISVALENIDTTPIDSYSIEIEIDDEDYEKNFYYSSSSDKLYLNITIDIDEDDIEDEYDISFEITNEDTDEVEYTKSSYDIENVDDDDDDDTDYTDIANKWVLFITQYTNRKYNDTDDKIIFVEKIISLLDDRIDDGSSKSDLFEEIIDELEDLVDDYENGTDEDDILDFLDIDSIGDTNNNNNQNNFNNNQNYNNHNNNSSNNFNNNSNTRNNQNNNNFNDNGRR